MKRRTLLAGLGASAAGSAILFGSGAFTQVEAERDLTIGVDEDSNALLALEAGEVTSVFSDSGELVIDTDELSDGNEGFNVNSSVLIGETEQDIVNRSPGEAEVVADLGSAAGGTGAAFRLTNNFDDTVDAGNRIDVGINLEDVDAGDNNITFIISQYESGDGRSDTPEDSFTVSDGSQVVINNLNDGDQLYFAIEIETGSDDISGNITFRAGPNLKNGFPTSPVQADNRVVNVTQDTTFSSISDAIDPDNADPGDLIQVDSSKFTENVTVNVEGLTLEGPNAGTPGDDPRGAEALIKRTSPPGSGGSAVSVTAPGVTVDGFQIESAAQNGISVDQPVSNVTIQNNRVTSVAGNTFGSNSGDRATGNGIAFGLPRSASETTVTGLEVSNNVITGVTTGDLASSEDRTTANGIQVLTRQHTVEGMEITGNVITDLEAGTSGDTGDKRARGVVVNVGDDGSTIGAADGFTIADNSISGLTGAGGFSDAAGIALFEAGGAAGGGTDRIGPENFTVANNQLDDLTNTGKDPAPAIFVGGIQTLGESHSVTQNQIDDGSIIRFAGDQSGFDAATADALNADGNTFTDASAALYYSDATDAADLDAVFNDNDFSQVDVVVGNTAITRSPSNDEVLNVDQVESFSSGQAVIQTAVNNANAGNTIAVGPGEFQGPVQVTDDQTNLTIRSTGGPKNTEINATDGSARSTPSFDAQAVRISVDGVTIDGFNIVGDDTIVSGVFVAGGDGGGDNVRVVNNIIEGMSRPGFGGPSDNSAGIVTAGDPEVVDGFVARNNTIRDIGSNAKKPNNPDDGTRAQGISLIDIAGDTAGDGAVIENNTISGLAGQDTTTGIAVQPLNRPTNNGTNLDPGVVVQGNDISGADIGLALGDEGALEIANNIFTNVGDEIVRPS